MRSNLNIMNEIKKIVPKELFLNELKFSDNGAIFKGEVNNDLGIKIINVFILKLVKSPLFNPDSVKLKEIKQQSSSNAFEFTINAKLTENMTNINLEMIKNKNNEGLSKKLLILKNNQLLNLKNNPK